MVGETPGRLFSPGRTRPGGASAARFRAPHAPTLSCALQPDGGGGAEKTTARADCLFV